MKRPRKPFLRPGSDEAIAAGCTCPVLDNAHGIGYYGKSGVWVMYSGCPIHGERVKRARKEHKA